MAQKQAQNTAGDAAAQPKKRGKLLLIVSLAVVLLAGGGGGAWFFMNPGDPHAEAAKPKPALFMPLDVFTANLIPDGGQPQFIQVALTLKTTEQETINLVKERMPEVRNRILLVLSGKRGDDLLPVAGKEKLALDIATAVRGIIAPLLAAKPAPKADETDEKPAAEDADGGEAKAAAGAKPAPTRPAMEVLFTAFMIQ
jgi:flagellar FliL protein